MRFVVIVLMVVFLATATAANTIHVPGDVSTIQGGIDAAQAGDTVLVAAGTYHEHDISMRSGICLRGETGDPDDVVIDAQTLGRVILCDAVDASSAIQGLTLANGLVTGTEWMEIYGGGLMLFNSSPRVEDCVVRGCESEMGGGGIHAYNSTSVIRHCTIADNRSVDGGGLFVNHASPEVIECTFYDNDAMVWGGAVFCENSSSPDLQNCTLTRTGAHWGGGIWCVADCYPVLEDCIVAFSTEGEGVYVYDNPSHPSEITLVCCDVYGNVGGNYGGVIEDQTGINGNISADPLFCDPGNEDFSLAHLSPCLPENNECGVLMGADGEGCVLTGVAEAGGHPLAPCLDPRIPNPLPAGAEISFLLPAVVPVTLRIHDLTGRRVRSLIQPIMLGDGWHGVIWDGRDAAGRWLPSGVYFLRLEAGSSADTRRVVILR